jgi:hypothetical protein
MYFKRQTDHYATILKHAVKWVLIVGVVEELCRHHHIYFSHTKVSAETLQITHQVFW